jgi:dienelactone hydrolase
MLKKLTGFDTMIMSRLNPVVTEDIQMDGYRRQRVEIQTEPGVIMPLYVLIPEGDGPFPAVIAPHGHGSGGKYSVAGRRDIPELVETIANHNYDYGVQFVRAGFITFCPDARGFGERLEKAAQGNILSQSCQWLNNMAYPLGQTVTGMWAWDLHRLADYIETRKECVPGVLGCAGLSGGGLQTLWATAFEPRIRCAVISGYFYGYKESLLDMYQNCSCNYVPHLYENVDMGDIAALIAPRPLLIETGTRDPLNGASGLANVKSQYRITARAYRLFKAEDRLKHDIFKGKHRWNGVEAIPWMKQHLMRKGGK